MKLSRATIIIILGIIALFCIGAIIGALCPYILIYGVIAAVCVALIIYGIYFYYGQENNKEKKSAK